jgi:hypothetical protein
LWCCHHRFPTSAKARTKATSWGSWPVSVTDEPITPERGVSSVRTSSVIAIAKTASLRLVTRANSGVPWL